jgi:Ran GTPase-activating protein (RanGAP) involved in mRNA processing and transport
VLRWTKSSKSWPSASYNERILVGVLAQCTALAHLNLKDNKIGEAGVESLPGALGHLHLAHNFIGTVGRIGFELPGVVQPLAFFLTPS